MDFNKLAEPYGKKPERQRNFILGNGIPADIVDFAMAEVYTALELGTIKFATPAEFDLYILKVAKQRVTQGNIEAIKQLQVNLDLLKKNMDAEWEALPRWKKMWEVLRGRA